MLVTFQLRLLFAPFWSGELRGGEIGPLGVWRGTLPQPRSTVGHTDGKVGRRSEGLDQAYDATITSQGRRYSWLARVHETGGGKAQQDLADKETKGSASS